ncbi:MAG: DUF4411 family protein [Ruminococcus flavefaciens]|nr:DUF4411 family protein [Ruminococcus flavefaciens]
MEQIYIIDASALIDANHNYNMQKSIFIPIWKQISEMFGNGTLFSSIEIFDEVRDTDLKKWLKTYKECFLPLTEEIQNNAIKILEEFPHMINVNKGQKAGNSNGDPFLVATAMSIQGSVLVTNEKSGGIGSAKMPNVCRKYGIESINLLEFIDRVIE